MLGTPQLPFPASSFDLAHYSRYLIPFTTHNATYFIEVDRLLRLGGMACGCGGCLALQDASVLVKRSFIDIAMGLVLDTKEFGEDGTPLILYDITGSEDAFGDMDFKVVCIDHRLEHDEVHVVDANSECAKIFHGIALSVTVVTALMKIYAFEIAAGRKADVLPECQSLIEELSASHSTELQRTHMSSKQSSA
ncbi:hypothetical protein LOK49_LG02G03877 [Camellia lanceoleosa]|uniref:Uncharacterized protein n=1 Tax=Camellia lanceoleosa TaxID=1840588 RepID=A0ACC0ILU6_9ERIC|nr:hypothetical protein LOK49_LG02G03877 [Camellia lanceoleosa]